MTLKELMTPKEIKPVEGAPAGAVKLRREMNQLVPSRMGS
jgi:hypothetical protein